MEWTAPLEETQYNESAPQTNDNDDKVEMLPPRLAAMPAISMASPERFINRELSWLAFNELVLDEAENDKHPLLERLRFMSISASNLDEFFMVRVAGLKGQVTAGVTTPSQEGLSPAQQLEAINRRVNQLMQGQQSCWRRLRNEFAGTGFYIDQGFVETAV